MLGQFLLPRVPSYLVGLHSLFFRAGKVSSTLHFLRKDIFIRASQDISTSLATLWKRSRLPCPMQIVLALCEQRAQAFSAPSWMYFCTCCTFLAGNWCEALPDTWDLWRSVMLKIDLSLVKPLGKSTASLPYQLFRAHNYIPPWCSASCGHESGMTMNLENIHGRMTDPQRRNTCEKGTPKARKSSSS